VCKQRLFPILVSLHTAFQLFLEEERERELELLYENGIADSLNRAEAPLAPESETVDSVRQTEVANVTKQTTETLMAGERIMEALDLADGERAAFKAYEESIAQAPEDDAIRLQPPSRNPILAAYDLQPGAYVLRVVEKVPSTALQDALLVLPFGKVVSLMNYLNQWAQEVNDQSSCIYPEGLSLTPRPSGVEYTSCITCNFFPAQNPPSPDCCQPHYEDCPYSPPKEPTSCSTKTERYYRL
jgi:hypothetical protein